MILANDFANDFVEEQRIMLGLIQRVSSADVVVEDEVIGQIDRGILLLLGVQKQDDQQSADKLLNKVIAYRIFPDAKGHMNLSLGDVDGDLLIVSQFTIAANTRKGLRPSFSTAAPPDLAEQLYDRFVLEATLCESDGLCGDVAAGRFGADMKVGLVNDGPVTFLLET